MCMQSSGMQRPRTSQVAWDAARRCMRDRRHPRLCSEGWVRPSQSRPPRARTPCTPAMYPCWTMPCWAC
eukprot:9081958-Lingulodinium_polyedra.AAC.1